MHSKNLSLAIRTMIVLCGVSCPALAEDLPTRQPGHWQLTTIAETLGSKTFETCISTNDPILTGVGDPKCQPPRLTHLGNELFVDISCKTKEGSERTSAVLTGDFKTWYRVMSKITLDPPQGGMDHFGVTIDAKFLGPECGKAPASAEAAGRE